MATTHRLPARMVAVVVTAAAVLSLTGSRAQAATTYTPTGGPNVTFTGSNVSFYDIPAMQSITCPELDLSGSIASSGVSRPYGADAGSLTTLTSRGCTNLILGPMWFTNTGTWRLTVTDDSVASGWPAELSNVNMQAGGGGCVVDIAGSIAGTFDDATQVFDPASGPSGLTVTAVLGASCGLVDYLPGDEFEVNGTWTVSPALEISNP